MSGKGGQNAEASFASVAKTILHRWRVERDVWVSAAEVERARAYLAHAGIRSEELRDGRFVVPSSAAGAVDRSHLVLLSIKHLFRTHRDATP